MTGNSPYSIPQEPGRWRAIALAAAVHAALIAFLWIGVHWQSQKPIAVEAEIWSPQIREAAPTPPPPAPTPEPRSQLVVKEAPLPPKAVQPPVPNPEIALEREKKRKQQERKAEEKHKDKMRAEANLKAAQDKATKKAEADAKKKQAAAEAEAADKRRDEEMKRMLGQAVGTGAANSTGTAAQSQGPRGDPGYAQKVGARIKSNINFNVPVGLAGNPPVQYEVQLLPDGTVAGLHLTKSSGVPGFDQAVRRAIEKSQPYPKDKSGSVPSNFIGIHKPKDQ